MIFGQISYMPMPHAQPGSPIEKRENPEGTILVIVLLMWAAGLILWKIKGKSDS